MRLPYERYIIYLILTGYSDLEIKNSLFEFELPYVGNVYVSNIRDSIKKQLMGWRLNEDSGVLSKFRREDIKEEWIEQLEFKEIHYGSHEFDMAHEAFSDKRKRNILNIFLLCPDLLPDRISEMYEKKFGTFLPVECFQLYTKYFFDTSLLNDIEWHEYISRFDIKTKLLYEKAPERKSKYIQWKLGDEPDLNPADVSHMLMTDFFFLAQDAHLAQADGWDERAAKFANIALSASDRAMRNKKITGRNMKLDLISLLEDEEEHFPSFDELDQGDEELNDG